MYLSGFDHFAKDKEKTRYKKSPGGKIK
jgi:hypothetical protein